MTGTRQPSSGSGVRRSGDNRKRRARREPIPPMRVLWTGLAGQLRRSVPQLASVGIVVFFAGLGYGGYRWLTESDRFAVSEIEVTVAEGPPQVAKLARRSLEPVLGHNLFRISTEEIGRELEAQPWIARAHISRSIPDTLEVSIVARRAVAAISLGSFYLVAEDGTVFKRSSAGSGEIAGLPLITGIDREAFQLDPDAVREQILHGLDVLELFSAADTRPTISDLHLDPRFGVTLTTHESASTIHLGSGSLPEIGSRIEAFDRIWKALPESERARASRFRLSADGQRVTVALSET